MKYQLETIPVWDAFDKETECPLCLLADKAESMYIDYFLGNSVMVPEMRVEVNKTGFCPDHFTKLLYSGKNRHGLGLITHTHLQKQRDDISEIHKQINSKSKKEGQGRKEIKKISNRYRDLLLNKGRECMICSRIESTLERYSFTIAYLWKRDDEFRIKFRESAGFCLIHLPILLRISDEVLPAARIMKWLDEIAVLQEKALNRLESELLWYTQKFDYQNNSKPWGKSIDALHRTIQKFAGKILKI